MEIETNITNFVSEIKSGNFKNMTTIEIKLSSITSRKPSFFW